MKKLSPGLRSRMLLTTTMVLMLFGCQKDILDFKEPTKYNLSVAEAREYFNSTARFSGDFNARLSGRDSTGKRKRTPVWAKAHNRKSTYGDAVVVPLESNMEVITAPGGAGYLTFDQLNYLFMFKNSKKEVQTEHVTLMPDAEWFKSDQRTYIGQILVNSLDRKDRKLYTYLKDGTVKTTTIVNLPPLPDSAKNGRENFGVIKYRMCVTTTGPCGVFALGTPLNQNQSADQCASTYCKDFYVWDWQDPWGGATGTAGTGGWGSEGGLYHNYAGWATGGGGGGTGGGTGNYVPNCDPTIPPGTSVPSTQLPPCQTITPVPYNGGGINMNFVAPSAEPHLFFDEGDPMDLWWQAATLFATTQPIPLPSYSAFYAAYPKNPNNTAADMPANDVYNLIGGRVLELHLEKPEVYKNACALRISRALNYSGPYHEIPKTNWTVKGADGKNYFTSQAQLFTYMMIKYQSAPKTILDTDDGGDYGVSFAGKLSGKKGAYFMEPINKGEDGYQASGHATIWTGIGCIGRCDFSPPNPNNQKKGVKQITLFEMN
ncbi:T6SS effector amidase Tae4 family protein [Dyadobacter sp. 676]|uniref:T6SS effector amidase Tae4 family protein n=1 Tax=Dyadobacter sp. 676 TaxID=3088362 RepID=A0AAU8FM34_9BACT